ncbi:MscS Mechanosensitive ion channel [hydrothermal vent metagenome]|uniref:MscS Mechanosensitive ion channel n=1 Tax=hydrothermal vent metagenome TaxID=652676 RepID=A0A3B1BKS9_9ZZZZ
MKEHVNNITEFIQNFVGISPVLQTQLFKSFVIILVLWIIRIIIIKSIIERLDDYKERYFWTKTLRTTTVIIGLLFLSKVWFGIFESIGTFLGLLSAGLAIAFKDMLVNIGAWVFLVTRKPLIVGDRVQIDDVTGDVIDIRLFQFSVMEIGNWVDADQSTGRIVHIPNGLIFTKWQANFTAGFEYIWNEIPVLVTFESDWKKAKQILSEVLNKHASNLSKETQRQIREASKKFMIIYKTLTPIVYTSVKDSGVLLSMRFLCHVKQRRGIEQIIWEEILDRFAEHDDIDFAYPTTRFYDNRTEGKGVSSD